MSRKEKRAFDPLRFFAKLSAIRASAFSFANRRNGTAERVSNRRYYLTSVLEHQKAKLRPTTLRITISNSGGTGRSLVSWTLPGRAERPLLAA